MKILVAEDHPESRYLLQQLFQGLGHTVSPVADGLEALEQLELMGEALPDLIVSDALMPRMDGFGLLQAIKADARMAPLPVILMTSRADPEDVRRGLDLGASAYITKQKFDQRELLAVIGQLL